jgi:hypothetical protein
MSYDITIWEQIQVRIGLATGSLIREFESEIAKDRFLIEYQGRYPVPWQLREIVQQRAQSWVHRLYDRCCDVHKSNGKELTIDFDQAVWAFCIEPFLMREEQNRLGYKSSRGLELLLCAVGSPPEQRNLLKVGQKDCCLAVRTHIYEIWYDRLHHLPSRINKAIAAMALQNEAEMRAARIVGAMAQPVVLTGLTPPSTTQQSVEAIADASKGLAVTVPSVGMKSSVDPKEKPVAFLSHQSHISEIEIEGDWAQIEVIFLSDERVQIRNAKSIETRNYAEFGFQDGRSQNPTRAWETLRRLAELRGIITDGTQGRLPWPKLEKRVQEIRSVFREHFRISSDPIPFVSHTGYQARFKICCGPSYRT